MSSKIEFSFLQSIFDISSGDWQCAIKTDYPFIQYDFLAALEASGATTKETGWRPSHLVGRIDGSVVVIMPLYIKTHSYGEYVFDFQWAEAFHRNGVEYYPKLVSAIPYTPASSRRVFFTNKESESLLLQPVIDSVIEFCQENSIGSWHILFPTGKESTNILEKGLMQRVGLQYHWFNKGYSDFEHFLVQCKRKQRKNIRSERLKIKQQGIEIEILSGENIQSLLWQQFFVFYQMTYVKRSGHGGYLNEDFFNRIGSSMASSILMIVAKVNNQIIAASLFFKDAKTLYGRYWGCVAEFDFLHFELCYYQGVEYCINHKLEKFDAGAQGEHKIQRGFEPIETYSNHWIKHPQFAEAIEHFLQDEMKQIKQLSVTLSQKLPFK